MIDYERSLVTVQEREYLLNPNYDQQKAEQNPYYCLIPYLLAVKQLPNGLYGIGKVTEKRGKKIIAWEWVCTRDTGRPLQFSNTYSATLEKSELEYRTLQMWETRDIR